HRLSTASPRWKWRRSWRASTPIACPERRVGGGGAALSPPSSRRSGARAVPPGGGQAPRVNQVVTIPGRAPDEIVLMAHRDDTGSGPGANDNASGIATLIQLARSYGSPVGARPVSPLHTLVFVATDGGAFGALGAKRFAEQHRGNVVAR